MKAIILAGGQATRLWPLTEDFAKPLLIIRGLPIISHIIKSIPENVECLVSTNPEFKNDFLYWAKKYHPERKIKIFIEKKPKKAEKLGALRAIGFAIQENRIKEDVLVVAGDNFITFKISDFIKKFSNQTLVAAFDIKNRNEARKFGVLVVDKKKYITEFVEKPANPKSTLVSTACYLIPQRLFPTLGKISQDYPDNIGVFIEKFLEKNIPVSAYQFSGTWFDIGSYETYLALHEREKVQIYPKEIAKQNQFFGSVFVDEKAKVSGSILVNSVVMENSIIENSTLRDCVVARGAVIRNIDLEGKVIAKHSILEG